MIEIQIRAREPRDDGRIVEIRDRCEPEFPSGSVEKYRAQIASASDDLLTERWVAESNGEVIATAGLFEMRVASPGAYYGQIRVDPAHQHRGAGSRLYDHLLQRAQALGANRLYSGIFDNQIAALRFSERRGFRQTGLGERISRLRVQSANLDGFRGEEERLKAEGIRIETLAALDPDDEDLMRRLYELDIATHDDMPSSERYEYDPFDLWKQHAIFGYGRSPEWNWLALEGERVVGEARLVRSGVHSAKNAFTGVAREYRGRGIARALKARTLEWSRANSIEYIYTGNEAENHRMLDINIRLGYEMLPRHLEVVKDLT